MNEIFDKVTVEIMESGRIRVHALTPLGGSSALLSVEQAEKLRDELVFLIAKYGNSLR